MADDRIVSTGETANRAAVALDLANVLKAMPNGAVPDVVARLRDRDWSKVARLAGCADGYVPSMETRRTVVAILRRRQAEAGTDPFAGFPQ